MEVQWIFALSELTKVGRDLQILAVQNQSKMPDSEPPPMMANSAASQRPKDAGSETHPGGGATSGGGAGSGQQATPSKAMVKYGELVILGYNGQLPQGKST